MDNNNAKALTAVVIDAEYADAVAADLAAHFERELKRRIPPADVCDWLTCLVLDAGLRPGEHEINVSWLHEAATSRMQRMAVQGAAYAFSPLRFGNALGTFSLNAYPVETELTDKAAFSKSQYRHWLPWSRWSAFSWCLIRKPTAVCSSKPFRRKKTSPSL